MSKHCQLTDGEVLNARKQKKTVLFFENLSSFEEKMDGLKHFKFLEQFVIEKFFIKVTLFKKTGSISSNFFFAGKCEY